MGIISERIAIDLGTTYSIVARAGDTDLWRVPSAVAYERQGGRLVAFGEEAKIMTGKAPDRYTVVRPLSNGVIADFQATHSYVSYLLNEVAKRRFSLHTDVYLCLPWGATPVELRSYLNSFKRTRRRVRVVREPFAAALGCHLDVMSSEPCAVIDMGGGSTEMATIANGFMIHASTIRKGGFYCDELIVQAVKKALHLEIGVLAAELLKQQFGSVWPLTEECDIELKGISRKTGRPEAMTLKSEQLREILETYAFDVETLIRSHLTQLSSEARHVIATRGLHLAGGTSLLQGWKQRLEERLQIPVHQAADPQYAVIYGMQRILKNPASFDPLVRISEIVAKAG